MATTRRTAREIRIEKIVNLKNELNQLQGKPCADDDFTSVIKDYKLYELADMIESLEKRIEEEKRIQKVKAFFDGEGSELKARIEQRKEELRNEYQDIRKQIFALAIDSFAGTAWTVEGAEASFLSAFITISIHSEKTGEAVHGTEITLKFEHTIFGKGEEFSTNIGTRGSNDLLDHSTESRTFFYIEVGKLFADIEKLSGIKAKMAEVVESCRKIRKTANNIEKVEYDPFNNELEG